MTHDEVVTAAMNWLEGTCRCYSVAGDGMTGALSGQIPDAMGWRGNGWSLMVECKTSLSDFHSDRAKAHRREESGHIGQERWFLAPRGVINPRRHTLPAGWGLAEVRGARVFRVVTPERSVFNRGTFYVLDSAIQAHEHSMLLGVVNYYQTPGFRKRNKFDPIERRKAERANPPVEQPKLF